MYICIYSSSSRAKVTGAASGKEEPSNTFVKLQMLQRVFNLTFFFYSCQEMRKEN